MKLGKMRSSLGLALRCAVDPHLGTSCRNGLVSGLSFPAVSIAGVFAMVPLFPVIIVLKYIGSFGRTSFSQRDLGMLVLALVLAGVFYVLLRRVKVWSVHRFSIAEGVLVLVLCVTWWFAGSTEKSGEFTELYKLLTLLVVPLLFWMYQRMLGLLLAVGSSIDPSKMIPGIVGYHVVSHFGLPSLQTVHTELHKSSLTISGPFDRIDEQRLIDLIRREFPENLDIVVVTTLSKDEYVQHGDGLSKVRHQTIPARASTLQVIGLVALVYIFLVGAAYFSAGREGSWMELDIADMFGSPFMGSNIKQADPTKASVDLILRFLVIERDFERVYQYHLHQDLQAEWDLEQFRFVARNIVEAQYRYAETLKVIGKHDLTKWLNPRTQKEYEHVVEVVVELRNAYKDAQGRVLQRDTQKGSFYFQKEDEVWFLLF
ncbi:MAG: hypothetical protein PHV61_11675 [Limnochordia bacterium]|nr:hypothetical protein [Limnochordia bacterium]